MAEPEFGFRTRLNAKRTKFSRIYTEVFYGKRADNVGHCVTLSVRSMAARDSLLLASIYWLGRDSGATLASPQSDRSSELDRHTAVCVACGLSCARHARSASPGICAIIPPYGERAATAHSISNPSGLCEAGGPLRSRFS